MSGFCHQLHANEIIALKRGGHVGCYSGPAYNIRLYLEISKILRTFLESNC